jgi:hypothetical protein
MSVSVAAVLKLVFEKLISEKIIFLSILYEVNRCLCSIS